MTWNLVVTKPAKRELERIPEPARTRIAKALHAMQDDPFADDIKRLHPSGWRLRVGEYRVFYDLHFEARLVVVTSIKRRTSATY